MTWYWDMVGISWKLVHYKLQNNLDVLESECSCTVFCFVFQVRTTRKGIEKLTLSSSIATWTTWYHRHHMVGLDIIARQQVPLNLLFAVGVRWQMHARDGYRFVPLLMHNVHTSSKLLLQLILLPGKKCLHSFITFLFTVEYDSPDLRIKCLEKINYQMQFW